MEPWISSDNIERYDWSSHMIYLKKNMTLYHEGISTYGKPFVATANDEKCYLGALMVAYSSWGIHNHPVIMAKYPSSVDVIQIYLGYPPPPSSGEQTQDPRNDSRIKECLINKGQYQQ